MPSFIGSKEEFKRYVGPLLRNLVQQLTKKHKAEIGRCQHCGSAESLEAAHIRGRDRGEIIDGILRHYTVNDVVTIDLRKFERHFRVEHHLVDETILILCRSCHRKYDAMADPVRASPPPVVGPSPRPADPPGDGACSPAPRAISNTEIQRRVSAVAKTLSQSELEELCRLETSKSIFGVNFPVFVRLSPHEAEDARRGAALKDHLGINRWTLKYSFGRGDFVFAVTTQWYARHDAKVLRWLLAHEHGSVDANAYGRAWTERFRAPGPGDHSS
jgi:hypothetical protein